MNNITFVCILQCIKLQLQCLDLFYLGYISRLFCQAVKSSLQKIFPSRVMRHSSNKRSVARARSLWRFSRRSEINESVFASCRASRSSVISDWKASISLFLRLKLFFWLYDTRSRLLDMVSNSSLKFSSSSIWRSRSASLLRRSIRS